MIYTWRICKKDEIVQGNGFVQNAGKKKDKTKKNA